MIFTTVGMHVQSFERLIIAMDRLAAVVGEWVVIQSGCASCPVTHAECFDFATGPEMEALVRQARVVVSHAAAGSVLLAFKYKKPLVVIPRLKKFKEHIDDHQLELAKALAESGLAISLLEVTLPALQQSIQEATARVQPVPPPGPNLVACVRDQIEAWNSAGKSKPASFPFQS